MFDSVLNTPMHFAVQLFIDVEQTDRQTDRQTQLQNMQNKNFQVFFSGQEFLYFNELEYLKNKKQNLIIRNALNVLQKELICSSRGRSQLTDLCSYFTYIRIVLFIFF